jgi:histidine ammonia-lyase
MGGLQILVPGRLELGRVASWLEEPPVRLELDPAARAGIDAAAALVAQATAGDAPVYGVNTGFGKLARVRIAQADIADLQRRLVLSHMCGVGAPLDGSTVRLVLALKAGSLALGHSGVRQATIDALLRLLAEDALPLIPGQGSVGASGDLAPLAHVAGALIGVGRVRLRGREMPAAEALAAIGLAPLALAAKEGLALLNGTQVSTALAITGLFKARRLLDAALVAGAMSTDAALGSDVPFDPRIQRARNQPGQADVASILAGLLAGSEIRVSHLHCERVQDPYSLRCQPQVMGAAKDLLAEAGATLEREANGVSDNPLVFADEGEILSGGNFHAEPVAFAADKIAVVLAEIGNLSERRMALLTDSSQSSLPAFLTPNPGLNSGFMIPQVVSAALTTENKHLANAVATDTVPTCANQEDHVSLATYAARRLHAMADNLSRIVAIELTAAAQGIELRRPLRSSAPLERAVAAVRETCPFLDDDRPLGEAIEAVAATVLEGRFRP